MSETTLDDVVREALQSWQQHAHHPLDERMWQLVADLEPTVADRALRQALPACTACGCVTPGDPDGRECGCDAGCNDGVHPPGVNQMLAGAVVVGGETAPIVLERPDLVDPDSTEGGTIGDDEAEGWHVSPYSTASGSACHLREADGITFGGRHPQISFAEARRFAAALAAVADAAEAAQAEKDGGVR
jgi:hypothetical protein